MKMLGLVGVAVVALMAFVGASSGAATAFRVMVFVLQVSVDLLTGLNRSSSFSVPREELPQLCGRGSGPPRKPLENSLALVFARPGWKGRSIGSPRAPCCFRSSSPELGRLPARFSPVLLTPRSP
jgi:hypothetical protein